MTMNKNPLRHSFLKWLIGLVLMLIPIPITHKLFEIKIQTREVNCLVWVIDNESRGESMIGARAVLDVVLYRMAQQDKTACEIIAQPRQFQGYRKGVERKLKQNSLTRYELAASMQPVLLGCGYFHAVYVKPIWWKKLKVCRKIGKHIFYRDKR